MGLSEPRRDESAFVNDVRSGFLALLEGLASQRPVTLLFEDAHTLRPQMLDLIERIAARGRRGPGRVLVLVDGAHRVARGTSRVGNRRHEPGLRTPRAAARGRGRRARTTGRWRPARRRPSRDRRGPRRWQPLLHRGIDRHAAAGGPLEGRRGPDPADRQGDGRLAPRRPALRATRSGPAALRLSVRLRPGRGRGRRGRRRTRTPRADRRRDHRARGEHRHPRPSGGSARRSCATSRTRACRSASVNGRTPSSPSACVRRAP